MFKKMILKLSRSLIKKMLPLIFKILIKLKLNRRVINFLHDQSYNSNQLQDFTKIINNKIKNNKIIALDVGAQGGFNSDCFFPKKYNNFFEEILIEPIKSESEKLDKKKYVFNKGLWNKKEKKKLYILDKRLGSSSMYEPNQESFDVHNIKSKDYANYDVTRTLEIECDSLNNLLRENNIQDLDYLKIDTQGAELEILKGIGEYKPMLIRVEMHIFTMYKNVPGWHKLLTFLYDLNYISIDWKDIGDHNTRIPAEMDMIFIPNFNNTNGKNLILNSKEKFISLMLIFGQLNLLKIILKKINLNEKSIEQLEDLYFN